MKKMPMPGYGIAVIDTSQFSNVDFQGDDKFDTPQTGTLVAMRAQDTVTKVREDVDMTYGDLLNKKIYWKKYADLDGTFYDEELGKDIAFIKLESITGVDSE
jgi:hypothetical protein